MQSADAGREKETHLDAIGPSQRLARSTRGGGATSVERLSHGGIYGLDYCWEISQDDDYRPGIVERPGNYVWNVLFDRDDQ